MPSCLARRSSAALQRGQRPAGQGGLGVDDQLHLGQEPGVVAGGLGQDGVIDAVGQRARHLQQPFGGGGAQAVERIGQGGAAAEAGDADVEPAQRLVQCLREGTADGHHFADAFHLRPEARIGPGELFEVPARHLDDTVVDARFEAGGGHARNIIGDFV